MQNSISNEITIGPQGNLIKGHVLDCSIKLLEKAMKYYDPQLYIKWNSKKRNGHGVWEIRRKPDFRTIKESRDPPRDRFGREVGPGFQGDIYDCGDFMVYTPQYHESNLIHHVLDIPHLNYKVLEKLQKMDTWRDSYKGKNFSKELDYKLDKALDKEEDIAFREREYNIKQYKSEIKWLKEYVLAGGNPYKLADHWDNKDSKS